MIDRTTLDLRIAEHNTMTARVNAREWQRQGQAMRPPMRAMLAAALVALAARIDATEPLARRDNTTLRVPINT